jgi:alanine racemase
MSAYIFFNFLMHEIIKKRPTWAEINLNHLAYNFNSVKKFIGEKISYMAVIKADAYGHGAICCAKKLEKESIEWFGVALPEEAVELRESGVKTPILCLGSFWTGQENLLLNYNLTPVIYSLETAKRFNRVAVEKGIRANIHIKIDTGMNRIGIQSDKAEDFCKGLKKLSNLNIEGIMTHLAAADNLQENDFTDSQIQKFYDAVQIFEKNGYQPKYKDIANSPGAVAHKNSRGNMVRLGGILYGFGDDVLPQEADLPHLKPVLTLSTKISHLKVVRKGETLGYGRTYELTKDSIIATIPIGYQDGYTRSLSNIGRVIVRGCFAPVVGRISMDWTIVDVTGIPNVQLYDEVTIIGTNGNLKIKTEELAEKTGTISYEITCGINRRVTRIYVGS